MVNLSGDLQPPIIIGGIGGSGTRLIAQCLMELDFFMGDYLNQSNDNLWFTLLFKRKEIVDISFKEFKKLTDIFYNAMFKCQPFTEQQVALINSLAENDRMTHNHAQLKAMADSLLASQEKPQDLYQYWGVKEPNSHFIITPLSQAFLGMKYIYVERSGLDMAYNENKNQLNFWGDCFFTEGFEVTPYYLLKYWCKIHQRIEGYEKLMGKQFYLLNYDNFCKMPEQGIKKLCDFLDIKITKEQEIRLLGLIHIPKTMGQYKEQNTSLLDNKDIELVKKSGFDIGGLV